MKRIMGRKRTFLFENMKKLFNCEIHICLNVLKSVVQSEKVENNTLSSYFYKKSYYVLRHL